MKSRGQALLGRVLMLALVFNGFLGITPAPTQVQAQQRVIVVNADQPNLWTLEQASGKNFSPQIGVLINGVPLVHSIGLAQPLIRDDSETGRRTADDLKDVEINDRIERIDTNKIIFSFKMPASRRPKRFSRSPTQRPPPL